jgi:hemerythrin-like domain-containing protein
MIRMMGLVDLRPIHTLREDECLYCEEEQKDEPQPEEPQPSNVGDHEGSMAKQQLRALIKNAYTLYKNIKDDDGLEAWVQDKISKASDYIESIHTHVDYMDSNSDKAAKPADNAPLQNGDKV